MLSGEDMRDTGRGVTLSTLYTYNAQFANVGIPSLTTCSLRTSEEVRGFSHNSFQCERDLEDRLSSRGAIIAGFVTKVPTT